MNKEEQIKNLRRKTGDVNWDISREIIADSEERIEILKYRLFCYYHLDSINGNIGIKSLMNGRIYYSYIDILNDPFDCMVGLSLNESLDDEYQNDKSKLLIQTANRSFTNALRNWYKVACFTESPDNILMWSHYGRKHTGMCVEYDLSNINENNGNDSTSYAELYKVKYMFQRPALSANCQRHVIEKKNGVGLDINVNDVIPAMCVKSKEWEYEKEWRVIKRDIYGKSFSDKVIIKKVYLGVNISKEAESLVRSIAESRGIKVEKYKIDDKEYKLIVR